LKENKKKPKLGGKSEKENREEQAVTEARHLPQGTQEGAFEVESEEAHEDQGNQTAHGGFTLPWCSSGKRGILHLMNAQQVLEALQWRYAVKKFDASRKIPDNDWSLLEESLRLSPSSYGLQPWKFLRVKTPELLQQLRVESWNQSQVTDCSDYVVFTTRTEMLEADVDEFLKLQSGIRGTPLEKLQGYRSVIVGDIVKGPRAAHAASWAQRQSYIAMGFLMETAALIGVDTCPMEGLDPKAYDRILDLESTGYRTVAAVALGYRHAEDRYASEKKVRYPASRIIETR
jgi:nitroreductase